ncbi:MAG: 16S rRNA (uracil1498-N3)-methyltransferase [Brevundimonas sp.]|jgi:16S rRNA (uracil1498-N3)-methyltransferase|uniref:16S rRNA (uracil(1498)-N(3))-methyltransferase n=1 Tax=Brevundimonas sp. TaxID=1871086 RepID=UPI0039E35427
MIRLYVRSDLSPGAAVAPTVDQARYLTQVMRLKAGDDLLIFNGRDGEWRAVVAEVLKRGVVLKAEEQVRPQAFGPDLDLILAVVKKARVETVVEKAAELGARRVRLTLTRYTNAERLRMDRLDTIAEEAAEQTGRLDVPEIHDPKKLDALLDGWPKGRRLMFCDERGGPPAFEALRDGHTPSTASRSPSPDGGGESWSILIGPEGGFSPEERERLLSLPFATPVSLGPRVLRADTAAISAMTLWQAARGDWKGAHVTTWTEGA